MFEDELTEEEKRIMEEDVLEFIGYREKEYQDEWIRKMKILNNELTNQWKREKVQGQNYTDFRNKKIREKSLKKERTRKEMEMEMENKEKWEIRLQTIYLSFLKWINEKR